MFHCPPVFILYNGKSKVVLLRLDYIIPNPPFPLGDEGGRKADIDCSLLIRFRCRGVVTCTFRKLWLRYGRLERKGL